MGGEKGFLRLHQAAGQGSPPRGRGKGLHLETNQKTKRITPAWAGKRPFSNISIGVTQDHPRVGGEKLNSFHTSRANFGSPPRGRGKGCPAG